jgi:hypothetical protein
MIGPLSINSSQQTAGLSAPFFVLPSNKREGLRAAASDHENP